MEEVDRVGSGVSEGGVDRDLGNKTCACDDFPHR